MTEVWLYRNWTLTLPRLCVLVGEEDSNGYQKVLERGYPANFPSMDLYPNREAAIAARAVTIRKRIEAHQDRIVTLQGEVHMLTDMLPETCEESK